MCSTIRDEQFCYHDNILGSRPPNIKRFSGHLWRSILIFANCASYTRASKYINMLAGVCDLV